MKLIIAHLPTDSFDAARVALSDLGVLRMTVSHVHSAGPQSSITLRHRGAPLQTHLRAELRLECVATDGQSQAVVNSLRGHAGSATRVTVLDVEELHQEWSDGDLLPEDPRLDVAVG